MIFRIRLTGEPEELAERLTTENRNKNIIVGNTRLTLRQRSFMHRGPCEWNKLPATIRDVNSLNTFKREVKSWVKENVPRFL